MSRLVFLCLFFTVFRLQAQDSPLAISDSLYAVGEYSEAIRVLEKVDPKKEREYLLLAKFHQAKGQPEEALNYYRKVLQDHPHRILASVKYAKILFQKKRFQEADSIYSALSKKFPDNANFRYQLGLVREKTKDSTAIDQFYEAIALDPTHRPSLIKLSRHALVQKRYASAEKLSLQGLKAHPSNVSLLSLLAQAYYYQKRYAPAAVQFEELLQQGEESQFIHTSLGLAYYRLEEFEKAISHYQKALEFEDRDPGTHYNLGNLYSRIHDFERSEFHLLAAILLKEQTLDKEFLSLALTYKAMGKHRKSLDYVLKALEENPDNERAYFERAIAADNYYKDLQAKINFYQEYLDRFDGTGDENMLLFAERRKKELRRELHFQGYN